MLCLLPLQPNPRSRFNKTFLAFIKIINFALSMDNLQSVSSHFWVSSPQEINAFYAAVLNQIIIPFGILQEPFFSSYRPEVQYYYYYYYYHYQYHYKAESYCKHRFACKLNHSVLTNEFNIIERGRVTPFTANVCRQTDRGNEILLWWVSIPSNVD